MQAPTEFNAIVHTMAHKYCPLGYDLGVDAPQSLAELREEIATRNRFTVSSENCDITIFSEREFNHDFRAWHDATHYAIGADHALRYPWHRPSEGRVYMPNDLWPIGMHRHS